MSLDNVLAVAAAAKDSVVLLILGLGISIPLIVFGSTLLLRLMERLPVIITLGGALLGYLAGEMLLTDPAVVHWLGQGVSTLAAEIAGAISAVRAVQAARTAGRAGRHHEARASGPSGIQMPSKTFDAGRPAAGSKAPPCAPSRRSPGDCNVRNAKPLEISWNSSPPPGGRRCWPSS
jgi:hypothetical protein